jgi:pseudouridine synthase
VGRLDKETTGLLLLTSDGRVPNAVGRAGGRHLKTYWVRTEEAVSEEEMERLRRGVVITTTSQRERGGKTVTARTLECDVQRRPGGTAFEIQMSIRYHFRT